MIDNTPEETYKEKMTALPKNIVCKKVDVVIRVTFTLYSMKKLSEEITL